MHISPPAQVMLLTLLRKELWQTSQHNETRQPLPSCETCRKTLALAEKHAVEGVIHKPLTELLTQQEAPITDIQQYALNKWRIVQTNQHVNRTVKKVVDTLTANNIEYVMLKGQGVAQRYPTPLLRKAGDIDIYVGQDNYHKAVSTLMPLAAEKMTEEDKHASLCIDNIVVEIHHSVIGWRHTRDGARLQRWVEQTLKTADSRTVNIDGCAVRIPSAQTESMYLFYHMWHHLMHHSGVGLRQLSDWMLTLHADHEQIDERALKQLLKDTHLLNDWRVFGTILVRHMGLPQESFPLFKNGYERRADRLLKLIFDCGNHGTDAYDTLLQNRPQGKWKGKMYSMIQFVNHYGRMLTILPRSARKSITLYLTQGIKRIEKE